MSEFSAEFCPRCMAPIEFSRDADRLCEVCGWFGDRSEILEKLPNTENLDPVLAVAQCLEFYREVCRKELIAEQVYDAGVLVEADIQKIRFARRKAVKSIMQLFVNLQKMIETQAQAQAQAQAAPNPTRQILHRINGIVPWPASWPRDRFNACNDPCDALVGPCACGGWHDESEPWVQALLVKYNAEILESDEE